MHKYTSCLGTVAGLFMLEYRLINLIVVSMYRSKVWLSCC